MHRTLAIAALLTAACAPAPASDWQSLTWRGFQMDSLPPGWLVTDTLIMRTGPGGDIISREQFASFELELEWRIQPCGNSGVMFHVTEADSSTYRTGPEMQVLDDACHPDGRSRLTAAGSNFALHPAPAGIVRPAGEWNRARLVVRDSIVEHWLNDSLMVHYALWTPAWDSLVAASKFAAWPGYGRARTGHIALQDHGDTVAFRHIRIRVLP